MKRQARHNGTLSESDGFPLDVADSFATVDLVENWLKRKGYETRQAEQKFLTGPADEWRKRTDDGDLFVKIDGEWRRLEVKGIGYKFTSRANWPFDDFIICKRAAFDRSDPTPLAFFHVSPDRIHVGITVVEKTRDLWFPKTVVDRRYRDRRPVPHYAISPDHVLFRSMGGGE